MKCVICDKIINEKKDRWVNIKDYNKGKFESECFYHLNCWKDRFKITQEKIQQQANEWMNNLISIVKDLKEQRGVENVSF